MEIELRKCDLRTRGQTPCWVWDYDRLYGDVAHLCDGENWKRGIPAKIPKSAKRVFAVLVKKGGRHTFRISKIGQVEGFSEYCEIWRSRVRFLYRQGYRAIRFEYEE